MLWDMEKFITVAQFAKRLGITRAAIYKALEKERETPTKQGLQAFQAVKGGQWLILEKEASKWTAKKVKVRMRMKRIEKSKNII